MNNKLYKVIYDPELRAAAISPSPTVCFRVDVNSSYEECKLGSNVAKILVIDDEPALRSLLTEGLSVESYDVISTGERYEL